MRVSRKQLVIDYKTVFCTEAGKNVLADLKKKCPLLTDGVNTNNPVDANVLLIHTGREDVVKHIYKMVGKDPLEERDTHAKGE
jgi:hypothetical protein